jgi:CRISPR/Cas system CSM-associated protein Csm3 (group 7 of RAMP superfamily)
MDLFNRQSEPIREKNYFFIKRDDIPFIDLSRDEYCSGKKYYGKLFLTITALQDIFIGIGEIEMSDKQLYDAFSYIKRDPQKKILNIPGSSLKGTVLTNLALFLKSSSTHFMCWKDGASSVFFSDFPIIATCELAPKTIPARFGPNIKAVPRDAELKLYLKDDPAYGNLSASEIRELQATENILTVKKGSCFTGFINFKLLNEYELTILVLALGCLESHCFNFKIGGAKNRGMGLIKMEIDPEKSFYSENLKDASKEKGLSYKSLEEKLLLNMSKLKHDFPKIEKILQKMKGEYDQ